MALTSTLYRVKLDLSDIGRNLYTVLEFRVAAHPSEKLERVVSRILAYALLYEEGLEFGRGLSDVEEPALWAHDLTGQLTHWVDVGTPTAERIHAASKKGRVSIVCHKGEEALARQLAGKKLHRAEAIEVLYLAPAFVAQLAGALTRNSEWTLVHTDGELSITLGEEYFTGVVKRSPLGTAP